MLAAPVALAGCAGLRRHRTPPPAALHAVLGPPYVAGGIWRYPAASYDADETGLAVVTAARSGRAADGAVWDPDVLMGVHPTLQLPCVVRVTNLDTGRQIPLRLDDRGPAAPGRLLALTPRAALLLGPGRDPGVLRVRLQVDAGPSRRLTARLGDLDAPKLAVTAAPADPVRTEALPPPVGIVGRPTPAPAASLREAAPWPEQGMATLAETVTQWPVRWTELFIDAGGLGDPAYAALLRDRLGGFGAFVRHDEAARPEIAFRILIGPLPTVAAADAMLDRVLHAGVVDARIIVE